MDGGADTGGWSRVELEQDEPPPPPPGPPVASLADYAPLRRRADVVRGLLAAAGLAAAVALVFDLAERSVVARVLAAEPVGLGELDTSSTRMLAILPVQAALYVAGGIAFVLWLWRAYGNLPALGAASLRFGQGWTIGAWFVPFLSLVRPKQLVNDVWRGSDPELAGGDGWHRAPVPLVFTLWWAGFLGVSFLWAALSAIPDERDLGARELAATIGAVADAATVVTAALAVLVVDLATARQAARVVAAGGSAHGERWLRGGRGWAAAAALCAAGLGIGVLVVQPGGRAGSGAEPRPPTAAPAPADYALTDDFSSPTSGWIEDEDGGARFEYAAGLYRMTIPSGTWSSLLYPGVGMDAVEIEADAWIDGQAGKLAAGVGCLVAEDAGYVGIVDSSGAFEILVDPPGAGGAEQLTYGTRSGTADAPTRIGLRCESGPPDRLTLTIDGEPVARAAYADRLGTFEWIALVVDGDSEGVTGVFDNLTVRNAGGR